MALASLDATVKADGAVDTTTFRYRQWQSRYGADRGRALARLAEGLRDDAAGSETDYSWNDDVDVVLRAVADAILA